MRGLIIMIKKLSISLGIVIIIGLLIIKINPNFTFAGLLQRLESFPNLKSAITSINFPNTPSIPIPNIAGIRQLAIGINKLLEAMFSMAEMSLATFKLVPKFLTSLLDVLRFVLGV